MPHPIAHMRKKSHSACMNKRVYGECYTKIEIAGFGKIEIAGYNRILDYNPIKNDREINSYEFKSIY